MAQCKKCGEPIRFTWKQGKWWPSNTDGSDHWDLCREKTRGSLTPEQVRAWIATVPPVTTYPRKGIEIDLTDESVPF